ncbi:hypothetical protein TSUD_36340 [Trifolium subterraneum]|uniref:Uncharacterized protein n=1 Tax=Trifolium subterraneum TaxID=3900 RepID=A0A2Z6NFC0_TRISU|nr:hypothetical protein TSUD_36340 [Trifolium subterraneum]
MVSTFLNLDVRDFRAQSLLWRHYQDRGEEHEEWFRSNVSNVLGQDDVIRFCQDKWLGPMSFNILFPSLFSKLAQQEALLADIGVWNDGCRLGNMH